MALVAMDIPNSECANLYAEKDDHTNSMCTDSQVCQTHRTIVRS
jgi:hypothetical protein